MKLHVSQGNHDVNARLPCKRAEFHDVIKSIHHHLNDLAAINLAPCNVKQHIAVKELLDFPDKLAFHASSFQLNPDSLLFLLKAHSRRDVTAPEKLRDR